MTIKTEPYFAANSNWPGTGQHILAHQRDDQLVVYQAYNLQIAEYAVKEQMFGGVNYSYNRMSWIKPNFLWMMYRCGWASKENQERVLAIWITKIFFENILEQSVFSSFNPDHYLDRGKWEEAIKKSEVRLQWDPDHDPFGDKQARRAIQLGLKGNILEKFGKEEIKAIEDITDFVKEQGQFVQERNLNDLLIPVETVYRPINERLYGKLGLSE